MRRLWPRLLAIAAFVVLCAASPTPAHADIGTTIAGRLWDSFTNTATSRIQSNAPATVKLLQEAEKIFLGQTDDVTTMTAVQDAYNAMRVAGLLLLALCTVISLAEVAESGLMGRSGSLTEWFKRFAVATFMTMGGIHFYGLWIRVFNGMLAVVRDYLATHYQSAADPSAIYAAMIPQLRDASGLLFLIFIVVALVVLLVLWFLIGGIRVAEIALAVIIAPLVWPVYLIPALDDIPKRAFRAFLGLTGALLVIVPMIHLAVRWIAGGLVWNFVPAISMLLLAVFTPSMIKQILGQGNTGVGGLMTVASMLVGLKGVTMAAQAGAAVARPPATGVVPQAPAGPSAYPLAPIQSGGAVGGRSGGQQSQPLETYSMDLPQSLPAGRQATTPAALGDPSTPRAGQSWVIDLGQSKPGSPTWDQFKAVRLVHDGIIKGAKRLDPDNHKPEGDED